MSRAPFIAVALAALSCAFGAQAASPTSLTRVTVEYDPAVFELVEDEKRDKVSSTVLMALDGPAQFTLREFAGAGPFDETTLVSELLEEETVASPPYPIDKGPDGWACHFADFERQGSIPASIMRCAGRKGQDVAVLTVMTSSEYTSPALLETLRAMIASVRFTAPAR